MIKFIYLMKQKFFRSLADLRFAIIILLLISFISIIGTIIEQNESIEIYKNNYPLTNPAFGFLSWDIILKFELDHVYTTWWFISLILLFGINLITCTFLQQIPSLKIARRCQFLRTIKQFKQLKIFTLLTNFSLNKLLIRLKNKQYSVFQQKNTIYCYKGLIGRIAPIMVHFSMILILFGTIIGSLFGFKAQEMIPKSETFHIQNILNNGQLTIIPRISTRVNDFWITYTKQKTILQFYSDISILNSSGKEMKRTTSFVNFPLIYKSVCYYQTDWNIIGLRFQDFQNKIFEYPFINLLNTQNKLWLTWIPINQTFNEGIIVIIDNLQGYYSIYNSIGIFLGNTEINETLNINKPLKLLETISSTGLQIKTDPGILIIYMGFLWLMLSTLISYLTYSQVWIIQKNQKIFIGGNTTRAIFEFELEFFKFIK